MKKIILTILIVGVAIWAAWAGRDHYKRWKLDRLLARSQECLARGDQRNAFLSLQQAVQSNPDSVRAGRMMADLAEQLRSPNALEWRARVAKLEPNVIRNRVAWANTALLLGDLRAADEVLNGIDDQGKNTALYHQTVAAFALAVKRLPEAEFHFREAVRLEPTNAVARMNLAVLQLQAPNLELANSAREALRVLRTNSIVRADVLRQLTLDSLSRQNYLEAAEHAQALERENQSVFSDRLLRLEVLQKSEVPTWTDRLVEIQNAAQARSDHAFELARWMLAHVRPESTLAWIQSLSEDIRTNQPMPLITTECFAALKNWEEMDRFLGRADWSELEFFRFVHLARSARAQTNVPAARSHWVQSMKHANQHSARLSRLLQMVSAWNWELETEEVLWSLVTLFPEERWAFANLSSLLHAKGNTRGLQVLYGKACAADPDNALAQNNLAMTSLLLNNFERKPHELARGLHEKDTSNPFFASTYAYSLLMQKKPADALAVFKQLKPEDLKIPAIATFYGLALKAAGDSVQARKYLDLAEQAKLLPEERNLVREARQGI
ncbi:MAG: hypothetical protein L0Z50_28320 [Verrucomicrobiales bacterium]|nr:hypothetical protein [Verrucomicrobiales bacterium]